MKKFISSIVSLFLAYSAFGCSCGESANTTFCHSTSSTTRVAVVTVIDEGVVFYNTFPVEFIVVKVLDNLHNQIDEDTLKIWGQDGGNCGLPVATLFNAGDTLIVGLNIYNSTWYHFGNVIENYTELSYCGTEYLRLNNTTVTGSIAPNVNTSTLDEFKTNLEACIGLTPSYGSPIYPNPANNEITVIVEGSYPEPHSLNIVSLDGKICKQIPSSFDGKTKIDISDLAFGVYFVQAINADGIIESFKFVKRY